MWSNFDMIETLKQTATGAAILREWLGDGGVPVHPVIAERRAKQCAHGVSGKGCPHNRAGKWWERMLLDPIAAAIRRHIGAKNNMRLFTKYDDQMQMCDRCGCSNLTKPWVPMEHIKAHTSREQFDKFPEWCWITRELKGLV
jgi:hypothetical protein